MPDDEPDARAATAERSVTALFGRRLFGMPLTHLARVAYPAPRRMGGPWHYWWQAHYLDALVDAGLRALRSGNGAGARQRARRGDQLLATIRLRNLGRFPNPYYDDMAWLALAVDRLRLLHEALGGPGRPGRLQTADATLTRTLLSAVTDDAGGGVFWNTTRDFKNVPATGPVALHLARLGRTEEAARLVEWVYARLMGDDGLVLDGIRVTGRSEQVISDVYSYNQGIVLGALVTLGDSTSLARAAVLVQAVARGLTEPGPGRLLLRTHGGGDGGLFTGILARYLALAASEPRLDEEARRLADAMVQQTAEAFWGVRIKVAALDGRAAIGAEDVVFPADASNSSSASPTTVLPVELSTQLQAWTTLEAAAVR